MFSAYRGTWWNNTAIHQKVLKETNEESISSTLILVILQSIDWIKLNLLPLDTYQKKFWYVQAVAGGFRQSPFFNKIAGLRPATLLKKRLWHKCFPVNFAKFLRTPFLQNSSGRLLLKIGHTVLLIGVLKKNCSEQCCKFYKKTHQPFCENIFRLIYIHSSSGQFSYCYSYDFAISLKSNFLRTPLFKTHI